MGKRDLYWFLVSEVSVGHGEENMAEQNSSQLGGQEAEKGDYRRDQDLPLIYFFQKDPPPKPKTFQNFPK